jgi:hypothetical protein
LGNWVIGLIKGLNQLNQPNQPINFFEEDE